MKNICLSIFLFSINTVFAQEIVLWNENFNNTIVSGTYTGAPSNVIITTIENGSDIELSTFGFNSDFFMSGGPYTFGTPGPIPVKDILFQFPEKVIITKLEIIDINSYPNSWNDSFEFLNINFNSFIAYTGCCIDVSGAQMTTFSSYPEFADWLCSNPINSFRVHFTDLSLPTADVYYKIRLLKVPIVDPICIGTIPISLNSLIIGNNIQGTWDPPSINTSTAGVFTYTFTPNTGQTLSCSVPVEIVVLSENDSNCCQNTLNLINPSNNVSNLSLPINGVRHRETSSSIIATNVVNFGDNSLQNGVVYHAGDFIELNPGFEAVFGSQFSSYIEGCSSNYVYRTQNETQLIQDDKSSIKNEEGFNIIPNPSSSIIEIKTIRNSLMKVDIKTIYGKTIFEKNIDNQETIQIDVSYFEKGLYLVTVTMKDGKFLTKKLIKN